MVQPILLRSCLVVYCRLVHGILAHSLKEPLAVQKRFQNTQLLPTYDLQKYLSIIIIDYCHSFIVNLRLKYPAVLGR